MRRSLLLTLVLASLATPALVAPPATGAPDAAPDAPGAAPDAPGAVVPFSITVEGQTATGLLGLPATRSPQILVVLCHGFGGRAEDFRGWMQALADAGIMSVAMDYRGPQGAWKVETGYEDTIAATLQLKASFRTIRLTLLAGYSMGGEVSGLAVAYAPAGTFDYWFNGVGVMDLAAEWAEFPWFQGAIQAETGGTPAQVPAEYLERSPPAQAALMAGKGLKRVYMAYGPGDMIVPIDHAEKMFAALVAAGVPVSYYVVDANWGAATCAPAHAACAPGCTIVGPPCAPAGVPVGPAGHGSGYALGPLLYNRIAGKPDLPAPAVRGVLEGLTNAYVPSDVPPV